MVMIKFLVLEVGAGPPELINVPLLSRMHNRPKIIKIKPPTSNNSPEVFIIDE